MYISESLRLSDGLMNDRDNEKDPRLAGSD
jgi:hypothetical protein